MHMIPIAKRQHKRIGPTERADGGSTQKKKLTGLDFLAHSVAQSHEDWEIREFAESRIMTLITKIFNVSL